jgi:hypothetical protein
MDEQQWLAERFEENRTALRAVAYRMLGALSEADDAVQEAWLRLSRSDTSGIENLGGSLTTVVARVCLDLLRARKSRREEPLGTHVPDPIVSREDRVNPEHEALLADSVGLALLVVLDTLAPAVGCRERPRFPTPISSASEQWSTPSWLPRAAVTSTRFSRCSTPTSWSEPTAVPCLRVYRGSSAVRRRWPSRRSPSRGWSSSRSRRS